MQNILAILTIGSIPIEISAQVSQLQESADSYSSSNSSVIYYEQVGITDPIRGTSGFLAYTTPWVDKRTSSIYNPVSHELANKFDTLVSKEDDGAPTISPVSDEGGYGIVPYCYSQ